MNAVGTLLMIFCGTRFEDLTFMRHESLTQTPAFFELLARIKTHRTLDRIRVHKLADSSTVCPYRALEVVVRQRRQQQAVPLGPVWTDGDGGAWSARRIAYTASYVLRMAGVAWYRRPYKLKKLSASALVSWGGVG